MIDDTSKVQMKAARTASAEKGINTLTMTEFFLYLALIINLLYSLFYPVYTALHAIFHFIVLAFAVGIFAAELRIKVNLKKVIALTVFVGLTVAAILINHSGLGLVINILWPLTIIYIFKNSRLSSSYINKITVLMLVGWIIALLATVTYNEQFFANFEAGIVPENVNPNTMAIIIVFTSLFLQLYIDSASKNKRVKIAIYLVSFAALYRTRSRTSLVAFAVILLMEIIAKKKIKNSKVMGMVIPVAVIIAGIVFPFVYTLLFTRGIISYHTLFLGKRIYTGRQYIWLNLWEYLLQHKNAFLWGVGYNTELYSRGTFNLHNAYLSIFAQYGIPLFLFQIWYILRSFNGMYNKYGQISDLQFKCYQILVYVLIVGFGEGVLSYLPNMIFIAMAIGIGSREKLGDM